MPEFISKQGVWIPKEQSVPVPQVPESVAETATPPPVEVKKKKKEKSNA